MGGLSGVGASLREPGKRNLVLLAGGAVLALSVLVLALVLNTDDSVAKDPEGLSEEVAAAIYAEDTASFMGTPRRP